MSTRLRRLVAPLLLILAVALGLVIGPSSAQEAATPTAAATVREVLGGGEPAEASGRSLELVRTTIAPGTRLAAHTHPGMQVAWIESGELEYTVVSGEASITRAGAGDGTSGAEETLRSGETTTLLPGDSLAEPEGMVHFGENLGTEPVVILASTLFTTGAPPSSVVTDDTTPVLTADATPAASSTDALTTMTLVERADRVTVLDSGEPGVSVGDYLTWGPNALYDEANETDTGATTQGICTVFGDDGACMLNETVVFADGSTLELYGIQAGGSAPSTRTIIGGSGTYRGATGTVDVVPSADLKTFTKTFEIYL